MGLEDVNATGRQAESCLFSMSNALVLNIELPEWKSALKSIPGHLVDTICIKAGHFNILKSNLD